MEKIIARLITITGCVQGVGFRPFLYRAAKLCGISGWVKNTGGAVTVHAEGSAEQIDRLLKELAANRPPLARIDNITVEWARPENRRSFSITGSTASDVCAADVPLDTAVCARCLEDTRRGEKRRHGHPFTACTDCGPRYTVIKSLPYDRKATTMNGFSLCQSCREEMSNPEDRRFHAQINACRSCGPTLYLEAGGKKTEREVPAAARDILARGGILAVKGIGGYHLVVDAGNEAAVKRLREIKGRGNKPMAVMVPDLENLEKIAFISREEKEIMTSPAAPIVILQKKECNGNSWGLVSAKSTLGVMLPYTPLYHYLCEGFAALVVTSANRAGEATLIDDAQVRRAWGAAVDGILTHGREIYRRADDSVVALCEDTLIPLRVSRGMAPQSFALDEDCPEILAVGSEENNTFSFLAEGRIRVSPHFGHVKTADSLLAWVTEKERFAALFGIKPQIAAADAHPGYTLTRWAKKMFPLVLPVQHHHAHLAANLTENGCTSPVIGVIFDGQGYGPDGTVWGGEFLLGNQAGFARVGRLRPVPLAGGETAVLEPWRMAAVYLYSAFGTQSALPDLPVQSEKFRDFLVLLNKTYKSPLYWRTSSAGRLFDAVAAMAGLCFYNTYEGEAASLLEDAVTGGDQGCYQYLVNEEEGLLEIDWRPFIRGLAADISKGASPGMVSARFHRTLALAIAAVCEKIRAARKTETVALSGGVFQNRILLAAVKGFLEEKGFRVLLHRKVPPNDGGLSLGQAAVAVELLKRGIVYVPGDAGKSYSGGRQLGVC